MELGTEESAAPHVENGKTAPQKQIDFSAEAKVAELITAYREMGRLLANIDPLTPPPTAHPLWDFARLGFSQADLTKPFTASRLIGMSAATLGDILNRLKETYCGTIG